MRLSDRAIIALRGEGVRKFLNGLCAQELLTSQASPTVPSRSTAFFAPFLNSHGRVLFDSLIYSKTAEGDQEEVLIDVHASLKSRVLRHLVRHKLREAFSISDTDLSVVAQQEGTPPTTIDWITDPRYRKLPVRGVVSVGPTTDSVAEYHAIRIGLGVPEGPYEFDESLPLHMNLDFLHGISFTKGCYIGQELTTRTMRRGVIRRRLVVLKRIREIQSPSDIFVPNAEVRSLLGQPIGRVVASAGENSIAQIGAGNGEALNDRAIAAAALSAVGNVTVNGVEAEVIVPGYYYED